LFYQNYRWFGFNSGKQEEIEERKAEAKAKTTKAEIEEQFKGVDPKYIVKNDDGSFSLTDAAMLELSALTGTNISKTGNY
jgi:hypothetical protein